MKTLAVDDEVKISEKLKQGSPKRASWLIWRATGWMVPTL